jgi:hypothetical protein
MERRSSMTKPGGDGSIGRVGREAPRQGFSKPSLSLYPDCIPFLCG